MTKLMVEIRTTTGDQFIFLWDDMRIEPYYTTAHKESHIAVAVSEHIKAGEPIECYPGIATLIPPEQLSTVIVWDQDTSPREGISEEIAGNSEAVNVSDKPSDNRGDIAMDGEDSRYAASAFTASLELLGNPMQFQLVEVYDSRLGIFALVLYAINDTDPHAVIGRERMTGAIKQVMKVEGYHPERTSIVLTVPGQGLISSAQAAELGHDYLKEIAKQRRDNHQPEPGKKNARAFDQS